MLLGRIPSPLAVLRREDGSFIVVGAIAMLVFALLGVTVIHFGDVALHRRHLQLQTDAAALAGGQAFSKCLVDPANALTAMSALAGQYGGFTGSTSYNQQLASGTPSGGTVATPNYNRVAYPSPSTHPDDNDSGLLSDNADPCTTSLFDVKATESNVRILGAFPSTVNAHSAVQIRIVAGMTGMLPLAVPDVRFNYAFATFINEATGGPACTAPCSVALNKAGIDAQGQQIWTSASSLPVTITKDVGVRFRLVAGNDSTLACGVQFTECFTDPAATNQGVLHIRGWQSTSSTAVQAYNVTMVPGTCAPDGYFMTGDCSAGINAELDFGDRPVTGAGVTLSVRASIDGTAIPLIRGALVSGTTYLWSASGLPIVGAGAHPVTLNYTWQQTSGTWRSQACTTGSSNPCKETNQSIENGSAVQRPFEGSFSTAGPIKVAQVGEGASTSGANSFQIGSVHSLKVTIATAGTLQTQEAANDPLVDLKVINGVSASQEQALDCDPALPNFKDEVINGCSPQYIINTSPTLACPAVQQLWNTAQPWDCVKTQTGNFVGQLDQALKQRVLGGSNSCSAAPIHWPYDETRYPKDTRVVPLIITPFGTFQQSGNNIFPVIDIAAFYIMGWDQDPCLSAGQTVSNGSVIGHFIHYIPSTNTTPSGKKCDLTNPNQVTPCMPVLIR